jgi:hypothetical protein
LLIPCPLNDDGEQREGSVLPWEPGEADKAAKTCFEADLLTRRLLCTLARAQLLNFSVLFGLHSEAAAAQSLPPAPLILYCGANLRHLAALAQAANDKAARAAQSRVIGCRITGFRSRARAR